MTALLLLVALTITTISSVFSADSCSRKAMVNYQDVLVDASSSNRGEGLRYYLQKDPVAKKLLEKYQEGNKPTWHGAALSSVGTGMMLAGLLRVGSDESETLTSRTTLLYGGITMIAVSYLISRTNQYNNEWLLQRSVEEYNKRNSPRIYFSTDPTRGGQGTSMGLQQEF